VDQFEGTMNSWLILILAGLCEVVWALGLKFSNGLTHVRSSTITIIFMIVSIYLLAIAARHIPIGISYSIWVGIGAVGAFLGGIFLFQEKVNLAQISFFMLILVGVVGLKVCSTES